MLDLLEMDQYACGTYRYTRKDVPLDIKTTTLREIQRGEAIFRQHGNLVANVRRDKKLVYVMSTNSSLVMSTCNRKEKDGTLVEVSIPTSTKRYNQYTESGVEYLNNCYLSVRMCSGAVGRPKVIIEKEKIEFLRELRFSSTEIARIFGVCRRTLYNVRAENGMIESNQAFTWAWVEQAPPIINHQTIL